MALLRIIHASDLPDPGQLAARLISGEVAVAAPAAPAAPASAAPAQSTAQPAAPANFRGLVALLEGKGQAYLAQQLHDYVGLVRYAPPELVLRPVRPLGDLVRELTAALNAATETRWQVSVADEPAQPTLLEQEEAEEARARRQVLDSPMVKAAFEAFPDAELAGYTAGHTP
jgi:DNA polymerase-3 subunit gamma/tau